MVLVDGADTGSRELYRVGLSTMAAIAIHNFPEGFAAFLAIAADGRTGLGIAFGVILHNIPEGMSVRQLIVPVSRTSMPLVYRMCTHAHQPPPHHSWDRD